MTSPMDEALRRTADAVALYEVPERIISIAAQSLESMRADLRHTSEVDALVDAVLVLATSHRGPHPECADCHAILNALAVAMGVVRAEADLALTRMLGSESATS